MNNKIKIAYLCQFSPEDRRASSGTNYKIAEQLSAFADVTWIPIKRRRLLGKYLSPIVKLIGKLFGKNVRLDDTPLGSWLLFKSIDSKVFEKFDCVAAFFCLHTVYYLSTKTPIIYFTDASIESLIDYYPEYSHFTKTNKVIMRNLEERALKKVDYCVVSSEWASKNLQNLGVSQESIRTIEYGANIDEKDIVRPLKRDYKGPLNVLFLGVHWARKGGDIAVEAVKWLNENGVSATLHIIGIKRLKKEIKDLPYVEYHGFLNKNEKEQYCKLIEILKKSHILLLPTKAECAGIAFAEASANGIPSFTFDTGGISNYVKNGVNGYRLPLGSTGVEFGIRIKKSIDENELEQLSQNAIREYEETLNWNRWGRKTEQFLNTILHSNRKNKS